jgi:hypothetical protein
MRGDLFPCPGCARHVRRSSLACPFCALDVREAARTTPIRRRPRERLGRAATFAFGAAAISAGCSTSHPLGTDAGADVGREAPDAGFVMADAVAVYGGPDAPIPDTGAPDAGSPTDDADVDAPDADLDADLDAGDLAIYGGPPPPGGR